MPVPEDRVSDAQREVRTVRRRAVGRAIATARTERGLTQTELAEAAGISRSSIARLEAGDHGASVDVLFNIAVALGTKPSALLAAAEADDATAATLKLQQ